MQRVMIVGAPGSGKSTLARALGARLGLPVHHMDRIHFVRDWQERPKGQKIALAQAVEAQDAWIFEGSLSATYETRLAHADMFIWLDLPVGLRLWRVTKRLFRYFGRTRPDLPEGCNERLHPETLAFYWFIWTSRHTSRAKIADLISHHQDTTEVAHLTSRRQVAAYVARLPSVQSR